MLSISVVSQAKIFAIFVAAQLRLSKAPRQYQPIVNKSNPKITGVSGNSVERKICAIGYPEWHQGI